MLILLCVCVCVAAASRIEAPLDPTLSKLVCFGRCGHFDGLCGAVEDGRVVVGKTNRKYWTN